MKIAWFSAGITSAVACKLAVDADPAVEMYYIDIASAHQDNARFIADCEQWIGKKVHIVTNTKGYRDQFDVIRRNRYINGPHGARCTLELKKNVRYQLQDDLQPEAQVFGFEYSKAEINRAIRFKEQYPDTNPIFPLIESKLTKNECAGILAAAGIELPTMYKLGYNNNNCIGCVKGGRGYWNHIRRDFPEVFQAMAEAEREIGASCLKDNDGNRLYLDELHPDEGRDTSPVVPACGMFCQVEFADIMHRMTDLVMSGETNI